MQRKQGLMVINTLPSEKLKNQVLQILYVVKNQVQLPNIQTRPQKYCSRLRLKYNYQIYRHDATTILRIAYLWLSTFSISVIPISLNGLCCFELCCCAAPLAYQDQFHISDPLRSDEAIEEAKWRKAMDEETDAIERNKTWELTNLPKGHRAIRVKWV